MIKNSLTIALALVPLLVTLPVFAQPMNMGGMHNITNTNGTLFVRQEMFKKITIHAGNVMIFLVGSNLTTCSMTCHSYTIKDDGTITK
jgi:hypothetical protein